MSGLAKKKTYRRRVLSQAKVVKAYRVARTTRKAAKLLGVSHWTVQKYLHAAGIPMRRGRIPTKQKYIPNRQWSRVATWLRKHQGITLPRSPKQLAFIIGVSTDSVKCYLYRRREYERRKAILMPDLRQLDITFRVGERTLTTHDIERYELDVDPWTFRYHIKAEMKGNPGVPIRFQIDPVLFKRRATSDHSVHRVRQAVGGKPILDQATGP